MTRVQTVVAVVLVALYVGTVYAAIRNPALIPLATVITPVVLLPVGFIFPKAIRDLFSPKDPPKENRSSDS